MTDKKVSCFWQCGFSLMPIPLGLWAFYRIKKLKLGCLLYLISILGSSLIYFGLLLSYLSYYELIDNDSMTFYFFVLSISLYLISAVFILYYIEKWSEEWNKKIPVME